MRHHASHTPPSGQGTRLIRLAMPTRGRLCALPEGPPRHSPQAGPHHLFHAALRSRPRGCPAPNTTSVSISSGHCALQNRGRPNSATSWHLCPMLRTTLPTNPPARRLPQAFHLSLQPPALRHQIRLGRTELNRHDVAAGSILSENEPTVVSRISYEFGLSRNKRFVSGHDRAL